MLQRLVQKLRNKWFSLTKDEMEELEEIDLIAIQVLDEFNRNRNLRSMA